MLSVFFLKLNNEDSLHKLNKLILYSSHPKIEALAKNGHIFPQNFNQSKRADLIAIAE